MTGQTYPRSTEHLPGTWNLLRIGAKRSATFNCRACKRVGFLVDHAIAPDGTVTPSVVCPSVGCTFHEFIRLEGWDA